MYIPEPCLYVLLSYAIGLPLVMWCVSLVKKSHRWDNGDEWIATGVLLFSPISVPVILVCVICRIVLWPLTLLFR